MLERLHEALNRRETEPRPAAPSDAPAWLNHALNEALGDPERLKVLWPQIPRQLGRQALVQGAEDRVETLEHGLVNLRALRVCDAAACVLLEAGLGEDTEAADAMLDDLYSHGDMEERTMALRAAACRPPTTGATRLLHEVQRTNMVVHVEAGVCDTDHVARTLRAKTPGFGIEDFNRLMLKLAFQGLPANRVLGAEEFANADLSSMLQGLATEREAAGRSVWSDTVRFGARAPAPGTLARVLGGLEHGDDAQRLAAAESVVHLRDHRELWLPLVEARIPREKRPEIAAALRHALVLP